MGGPAGETAAERRLRLRGVGWIGVDLDGTLAEYFGWLDGGGIGAPIPAMVNRVRAWRLAGIQVRIFTARVGPSRDAAETYGQRVKVEMWCREHLGEVLPVTHEKDFQMIELWDDRAVQVVLNTGRRADGLED